MEPKKLAVALGIAILLPLFLGLFVDAVYSEPKYEDFCKNQGPYAVSVPAKDVGAGVGVGLNCTNDFYNTPEALNCTNNKGNPVPKYNQNNCQVFDKCDYCGRDFQTASDIYNRNIFFILAPLGFIIVVLGIYLTIEYMGVGLMFAGLITMFYATVRSFTSLSKLFRALVILIELLLIMWIAYAKIDQNKKQNAKKDKKKKR